MKTFLCQENGEQFTVKAKDLAEAQEHASLYGGEAIRELKPKKPMTKEQGYKQIHSIFEAVDKLVQKNFDKQGLSVEEICNAIEARAETIRKDHKG